ncbi:claudin-10-like [Centroberyx affinis]|uniref:claudin-10-like n=1 Tax=Centroberyx affinis TaxID=166261 RepID=UPI003A5BCE4D
MWRRLAQILGLLVSILGWGLVASTLAMDHWRVAQLGGEGGSSVVTAAWYWSNLWKDCYEDSTTVVNCVDFGVLWAVKSYIQAVRGLLMIGLGLGLVGTVLTFFGMECTYIGGGQRTNDKMLITASALHLVGCVSDMVGYCLYINRVAAAILHGKADPSKLRYDIGTPLYLGLVGSFLILLGCTLQCATACRVTHPKRREYSTCSRNPMVPFIRDKGASRGNNSLYGQCSQSKRANGANNFSPYKMAIGNTVIV